MKSELQAVILAAGKGSRMTELTNQIPKCLLPIANKPMIHFPLKMLIEADFTDVIIVVPDVYENEIKTKLSSLSYKINIEFATIPFNEDLGTADSLKLIHQRLTSDVLILSCDLISNYPLKKIINYYRINDPSLTILISNEPSISNKGLVPGTNNKLKIDKDIIGIDSQDPKRIVFLNSEVDFEEFIKFRLSMIKLCPNIDLFTNYLDCHVYILKKYLIDYLVNEKDNISSIKGELVPLLIKTQFKKPLSADKYNPYNTELNLNSFKLNKNKETKRSVYSYIYVNELEKELDRFNPLIDKDLKKECEFLNYPHSLLTCSPVVVDSQKYFISRSNNLLFYYEINKFSRTLIPDHQNDVFGRAQINADCTIGHNNKISEKTSIKNTIIGNNCIINEKVRLENCLLMDNVVIEQLCVIKNSIIGHNVKIFQKCNITNCVLASDKQIAQSSTLVSVPIVHTDQMEINY